MPSQTTPHPAEVTCVVFKEIVEGDIRKFEAKSNDSDSGGGARDLRFSPYDEFVEIFRVIFPDEEVKTRKGNANAAVKTLSGRLHWCQDGTDTSLEATFVPPTDARPNEGRIPSVNTYPPFQKPFPADQGRILLLLVQRTDGAVWIAFATEVALRSGKWHKSVSVPVLRSLDAKRSANHGARGYIDFMNCQEYSDA